MTKPSRETSQHLLTTGPVLAQRGGLPAAVQSHHQQISCSHITSASFGNLHLSLLCALHGVQPYQTCSVVPPAPLSHSMPFPITQNKLWWRLLQHSRVKDHSNPPRQCSEHPRMLLSQHQDTESWSASPQPALDHAITRLLGCVLVLVLPKTQLQLQAHCAHSTLSLGTEPAGMSKLGSSSSGRAPELCIHCLRSTWSPLICPRALGLSPSTSSAVGNLSFGNVALSDATWETFGVQSCFEGGELD